MQSKPVFGIDLGTTYSCIAYVDEHGRPAVVPNSENALTTPSVVYFESESNIVVGQIAKDIAKIHPGLIVETAKRHMGDANWVRTFGGKDYRPQDVSALEHIHDWWRYPELAIKFAHSWAVKSASA